METELFDLAIEGTCLIDIFEHIEESKVVVIDTTGNYGSTYSDINALKQSKLIENFKIIKDTRKADEKVSVEACPELLGAKDEIVKQCGNNLFKTSLEFVDINDIYFIMDDKRIRIPTSKNDIAILDLPNEDLFYLYKAINNRDIEIIAKNFKNTNSLIYQAFVKYKIFDQIDLERLCNNFGKPIFVYPIHGMSEISECAALKNSYKGVTYVLNKNLVYSKEENAEYKHVFECDVGTLKTKEYKRRVLIDKPKNVRLVMTDKKKFSGSFIAYIARPIEFRTDGIEESNKTKVIGLMSDSKTCTNNYQLLYFIREKGQIEDYDLKIMAVQDKDVCFDISFTCKYDLLSKM